MDRRIAWFLLCSVLIVGGLDLPALASQRYNCLCVSYRYEIADANGLPVQPGDTIDIIPTDPVGVLHSIFAVDACFYQGGTVLGAVTQDDSFLMIDGSGYITGYVPDLDFDLIDPGEVDGIKINVYTLSVPTVYEWCSSNRLEGPTPPVPTTSGLGLVLLALAMGAGLLGVRRRAG